MPTALSHFRVRAELTVDELSFVTLMHFHEIAADRLRAIESADEPATVDELMIVAVALDVTPTDILCRVPENPPLPDHPLATGVLTDVDPLELQAGMGGGTALDHESRVR